MQILVMSRRDVGKLLRANDHNPPANTNIVSIRNTDQYRLHKDCPEILNLRFDDVLGNDDRKMTEEQAELVREFAVRTAEEGKDLIVHCHGGVSRSAGCASAVAECLHDACGYEVDPDGRSFWFDNRYIPNEYVYQLVCRAFGVEHSDEEVRELVKAHADHWFEEIEKRHREN